MARHSFPLPALLLITALATLSACGGGGDGAAGNDAAPRIGEDGGEVFFSYPYDGQQRVSPNTPLVLRLSAPVSDPSGGDLLLQDEQGNPVPLSEPEVVGDGRSLMVRPANGPLQPDTLYRLRLNGLSGDDFSFALPGEGIRFRTRFEPRGPNQERRREGPLRLVEMSPDGEQLPAMDFATWRLRFSRLLDTRSLVYGQSVRLTRGNELVPAVLLAQNDAISLDPRQDLQPGERYTLTLDGSIRAFDGTTLGETVERSWVARDSRPRSVMVQDTPAGSDRPDSCHADDARRSLLSGAPLNCVPIDAVLLGDRDATQQSGDVFTELAYQPNFPLVSPLRIARGSLLRGSNVSVKVAGTVPAGIETGDVTVTFLSDATGYLMPNHYSTDDDAPRQVRLYVDMAMTAENPEANGGLSQTLLQVELVGLVRTRGASLIMDALGVVEPEVLGQETGFGLLSLHTESYPDQIGAPTPIPDTTPPVLQSMTPLINQDGLAPTVKPGDPLVLNFSEPLDPVSVEQALTLTRAGQVEPFDWSLDGATLVVRPLTPLRPGDPYQVALNDRATDLADPPNPLVPVSREFHLPALVGDPVAPVATTTYPGFPCAVDKTTWNIADGDHGVCRGGGADDDHLPVSRLPAKRPIRVTFSQDIDPESVILGQSCNEGSFRVERVVTDASGAPVIRNDGDKRKYDCQTAVPGRLEKSARILTFVPDRPWEPGVAYRYKLQSVNRASGQAADDCRGGEAICSSAGMRLQTALLEAPEPDWGGPDMEIHFRGEPAREGVFQALDNLPSADVNGNGRFDDGEPGYIGGQPGFNTTRLQVLGGSALTQNPRLSCGTPEACDIQVVGGLNSEVLGPGVYDDPSTPEEERIPGVRVALHPTLILASSVTVKADVLIEGGIPIESPTGTQVMRMRYTCAAGDGDGACGDNDGLIPGWILETEDGPEFRAKVDLYLDAPYLEAPLGGEHNQHSYPLTMDLAGPLTFLPNGRMAIQQYNRNPIPVNVELSKLLLFLSASINLQIPEGAVKLQYLGVPIKR
ncbi:Ig-like domain-containing protein [Alloalcanivorax marinus]|uniref:Ig-like domain-containing protein n=1 Tax=Alloalcanivorax marinus TaxID=1177169 RepID=UPI0019347A79|nr:Ig-like domain-containing protein [Alloalcanivorax marinus]MBL7251955.1 Ig-like domain-containing protein [Alloalcanivorax marinus]